MKLSEAMRLGAMVDPQGFGCIRRPARDIAVWGDALGLRRMPTVTCAIGAALTAVSADVSLNNTMTQFIKTFPIASAEAVCPKCVGRGQVAGIVPHLNDHHGETREQIADWVETLEAAQPAAEQPKPVSVEV